MSRSALWCAAAALLVHVAAPAGAAAQQVQGRVVRADDSASYAGALVRLFEVGGIRVAQTTTSPDGAFSLSAPAPGTYVLAVHRIGHRPWRSAPLELGGGVRRITLTVPDEPVRLEPVSIEARSTCRRSPAEGSAIAALLAEADRALTVTRLAMERRDGRYAAERYSRTRTLLFETVDSIGVTERDLGWPIRSAAAESLAVHGFVREDAPTAEWPDGGHTYFGPDADLLLSNWFLSTHCFGVSEGSGADSGAVVVTFRPDRGRRPDVEGRLVLARPSLELRGIEWRYVRLPAWVTREGAGGAMTFALQPSGVYLPLEWWMRGPVPVVDSTRTSVFQSEAAGALRLGCWREEGGRIVSHKSIQTGDTAVTLQALVRAYPPSRCDPRAVAAQRIEGRVLSAADSAPAPGALVVLLDDGGARVARTSTLPDGSFLLHARAPGRYVFAVYRIGQHPWRSSAFRLRVRAVDRVTLLVPAQPVTLDSVAVGARSSCGAPTEGSAAAALLAEADRVLSLTRLAMERRDGGYVAERYARTRTPRFETVDSIGVIEGDLGWPIRSAAPESLAVHGFVRENAPSAEWPRGGSTYFGLDGSVLLSDWFLSTHCFGVSEGSGADSGAVVVTFRPAQGGRPDVEGRLVVARPTLELQRIDWRYVRLPHRAARDWAGGAMTLARQPSGVYFAQEWWMRWPVLVVDSRTNEVQVACWREEGARIVPRASVPAGDTAVTLQALLRARPPLRCRP